MHRGCADGSCPCEDILGGDEGHRCCIPRFGRKPSTCRALFSRSSAGRSFNRDTMLEGYYVRITCIIVKQYFDKLQKLFILVPASIIIPPVRPFNIYIYIQNLKDGSCWLQPPRTQCGGARRRRIFTLDPTSWSTKEVIEQRTRQSDYNALSLSLSHRSLTVRLLYSPW